MKTTISIFSFLLSFSIIYSQNGPIDFEQNGIGLNWTWTTFENDNNPQLEIVPNPDISGVNTSATVAKFTALQNGNPWAGFESMHGSDIGSFSFDATNCTVKIMIWKSVISDVGIKFVDATSAAQPEIKTANTLVNSWEELTFDFSSRIGSFPIVKDQIVVFPDFDLGGRTQDNVVYIDNIYDLDNGANIISQHYNEPLHLFPNPVKDVLTIVAEKNNRILIVDLQGKVQLDVNLISAENKIDLSELSKGAYIVKYYKNNFQSETIKLIKQ